MLSSDVFIIIAMVNVNSCGFTWFISFNGTIVFQQYF